MYRDKKRLREVQDSASLNTLMVAARHPRGEKWEGCVEIVVYRKGCTCKQGHIMISAKDWALLVRTMGKRKSK